MAKSLVEIEIYYFKDEKREKVEPRFTFLDNNEDVLFSPILFGQALACFENTSETKRKVTLVPYQEEDILKGKEYLNQIIKPIPSEINTKIDNIKLIKKPNYAGIKTYHNCTLNFFEKIIFFQKKWQKDM